jgi:hypothetical protein
MGNVPVRWVGISPTHGVGVSLLYVFLGGPDDQFDTRTGAQLNTEDFNVF